MDEEEKQQSDSKINIGSFFERVDSIDKVANSALSKSSGNFNTINNQKSLINSINVSIEALETKVRDIANFIIIEKKLEKDAEEDRRFEQQDEDQKSSMLERLAGLKPNNESEQTQTAGEEPKKGGGILGTLLTLGIGAFALKFLWPVLLPLAGKLITGALAKFAVFSIGGIGSLIKAIVVGAGLTGIGFGIGGLMQKFADSAKNRSDAVAQSAANAIKNFKYKKDGGVDGAESLNVEGGSEGGGKDGGNGGGLNQAEDYKAQEEYYQSEEYLSTLNEEGIGTSYEDMKKTLEKKDLIKTETQDLTIEQLERKIAVSENKIASMMQSGANEELIEFENDKIELLKEAIERKKSGMEVTATRTYKINNEIENKNLDLSLSETFSDKFLALNQQVDTLSEDFTGSINAEQGQMFSRPFNSPNTTVTVFKQTSSNSPFTSLMSNKYLSLNKTLPPEVYRAIK